MSAGSHRGRRPDYISSSVWSPFMCPENTSSSEWSQYVRPEFRRKVEIEWQMMRRRDLEIHRQNMQSRDHLGSSLGHFNSIQQANINSIQQANISSLGKRNAQGDEVGIQNRPDLEQAEIDEQNARDKRLEALLRAHFKRQHEVNSTTRDVDLTLRMWFQEEEEGMNEPNKKPKNA